MDFHSIGEVKRLPHSLLVRYGTSKAELNEMCARNDGKIPSLPSVTLSIIAVHTNCSRGLETSQVHTDDFSP